MTLRRTMKAPAARAEQAYYLLFNAKAGLMAGKNGRDLIEIPFFDSKTVQAMNLSEPRFLGYWKDFPCYTARFKNKNCPNGFEWINPRALITRMDPEMWDLAGYARQINDCHVNSKFCGKCGALTVPKTEEQGRFCEKCQMTYYPRVSPAIITAVIKEDQILLARGVNFPNKKMFSVLAGFVEPQERLEDCVRREVFEETGIRVKNVTYFDSQPWPFPDSLMIGFIAQYQSGEILIDPLEIAEAAWFKADDLPLVPGKPTLSGELIQWFVRTQKEKSG